MVRASQADRSERDNGWCCEASARLSLPSRVTVASERDAVSLRPSGDWGRKCVSDAPPLVWRYALVYLEGVAGHDR